jgi:hypothetical protein
MRHEHWHTQILILILLLTNPGSVPRMCVVAPLFGIALLSFEVQKEYM